MKSIEELLDKYGKAIVKKIQDNLDASGENATGKTKQSVKYSVDKNELVVFSDRPYFKSVETGSRPSNKKPSPEMVESLTEWAQAKPADISPQGAAVNILKYGSKLWQQGGRKDIFSNVWEEVKKDFFEDLKSLEVDKGRIKIHGA